MLATDKMSLPRRQMDAAHELGHAILHKGVSHEELKSDLKEIERQAFRFASAFLMPETTYVHEVQHYSLAGLLSVKERWRVSVKAQIRRLLYLEVILLEHYGTQLAKSYSANGWNKVEPRSRGAVGPRADGPAQRAQPDRRILELGPRKTCLRSNSRCIQATSRTRSWASTRVVQPARSQHCPTVVEARCSEAA